MIPSQQLNVASECALRKIELGFDLIMPVSFLPFQHLKVKQCMSYTGDYLNVNLTQSVSRCVSQWSDPMGMHVSG